jgi:hypothetical protein
MDDETRHAYIRNQFSAATTGDGAEDHLSEAVELSEPDEDDATKKEEELGAAVDTRGRGEDNDGDDFQLNEIDGDKARFYAQGDMKDNDGEFVFEQLTNVGERDDDELHYDEEENEWVMDVGAFDEAVNEVDWDEAEATADREAMIKLEQLNEGEVATKEYNAKRVLDEEDPANASGDGVLSVIERQKERLKSAGHRKQDATEVLIDYEGSRREDRDSSYDRNEVATVTPEQTGSFNPEGEQVFGVDDLDSDNTEYGESVSAEGNIEHRLGRFTINTSQGGYSGYVPLEFEDDDVEDNVKEKFEDTDNLQARLARLDGGRVRQRDGGLNTVVVTDQSDIEINEPSSVTQEEVADYDSIQWTSDDVEDTLEDVKETMVEETGTSMDVTSQISTQLHKDGANPKETLTNNGTVSEPEAKRVVRVAATKNDSADIPRDVVDDMINDVVSDVDVRNALKTNNVKAMRKGSVDVSDLDLSAGNVTEQDVKNAVDNWDQIRLED